jgi:site-specific DNA-methyltransferase (adenine-specific)
MPENKALHTRRASEEWPTPRDFFDKLHDEFHFTLDVCATPDNAKCGKYYTREDDGLGQSWMRMVCWCNPPFRNVGEWVRKAWLESEKGATVVCLVPSRTDTDWWHRYTARAEIRWIRGRLKFNAKENAPFACCLLVFHGGSHA